MSTYLINAAKERHPFITSNGYDYKAWAKQIICRLEKDDKTLLTVQIKFAHMALDIEEKVAA